MFKSSQEVCMAMTDRDGRVWAAKARLHGDFGGPVRILIFFFFFWQTKTGKQHAFTLLLQVSVLRADSWKAKREAGLGSGE